MQGHQLSSVYNDVKIIPIISGDDIILSIEKDVYRNKYNINVNGIKITELELQNRTLSSVGIHSLFVETNLNTNTEVSILNISVGSSVPIYNRKFNLSNYKN